MQAISGALREREAALLTVQAIVDERNKKRQAVNTGDENSSDKNKCALQLEKLQLHATQQQQLHQHQHL